MVFSCKQRAEEKRQLSICCGAAFPFFASSCVYNKYLLLKELMSTRPAAFDIMRKERGHLLTPMPGFSQLWIFHF